MLAQSLLRGWDFGVITAYLAGMLAFGIYFSRRSTTTEGYFVGNRSFPGWAVGLSMFATSISSVTFLAIPGAAFLLDWRQLVPNLTLPVIALLAIVFVIPFFRRGRLTSAFEYLEQRFGPAIRLAGAIVFILVQFVRLGTVLYLVSIPMQILSGVDATWVILVAGLLVAFYTVAGGFEAVIWIDVVQAIVLIVGAISPLVFILNGLPGGLGEVLQVGMEHHKFSLGEMSWNLAERTFPVMVLVGLLNWVSEYTTNQNVVQRYLAASSTREARKATLICCLMSVPIWTFFFFVGTSLFVYYQHRPDPAVSQMLATDQVDRVFPYFIVTQVPAGLAGLVIAGLLAATMALDSSVNSVATVSVVDIIKRHLCPGRDDAFYLRMGRLMSVAAGAVMIVGAMIFAHVPKESMVDLSLTLTALLFGNGLAGVFLVGFLTTRVNYACAVVGLAAAIGLEVYLVLCSFSLLPPWMSISVHLYWIGILANVFFAVVAYGLSVAASAGVRLAGGSGRLSDWLGCLARPKPLHALERLTVWTLAELPATRGIPIQVIEGGPPVAAGCGRTP